MVTPTAKISGLPLTEAALRIHVHRKTLARWIAAGEVSAIRTAAGRFFVPMAEIDRLAPRQAKL